MAQERKEQTIDKTPAKTTASQKRQNETAIQPTKKQRIHTSPETTTIHTEKTTPGIQQKENQIQDKHSTHTKTTTSKIVQKKQKRATTSTTENATKKRKANQHRRRKPRRTQYPTRQEEKHMTKRARKHTWARRRSPSSMKTKNTGNKLKTQKKHNGEEQGRLEKAHTLTRMT